MNQIILKNAVIRNIHFSHTIRDTEYDRADVLVKRADGKEDVLPLLFKKYSNPYKENDQIDLVGNIRSFSKRLDTGKNSVELYVFTYFDSPENNIEDEGQNNNCAVIDGRICKINPLKIVSHDKPYLHFILANNIIVTHTSQKISSYIPTVAWGNLAQELADLPISTQLELEGELQSREYKKKIDDEEFEIRIARELVVKSYKIIS